MFRRNPNKVKNITMRNARLAVTDQREYWDSRYRSGDFFFDADMQPAMECIDEILFQLNKLEEMGYSSDKEGVETFMAERWAEARKTPPAHNRGKRPNMAPSVTGLRPTPYPYED